MHVDCVREGPVPKVQDTVRGGVHGGGRGPASSREDRAEATSLSKRMGNKAAAKHTRARHSYCFGAGAVRSARGAERD